MYDVIIFLRAFSIAFLFFVLIRGFLYTIAYKGYQRYVDEYIHLLLNELEKSNEITSFEERFLKFIELDFIYSKACWPLSKIIFHFWEMEFDQMYVNKEKFEEVLNFARQQFSHK